MRLVLHMYRSAIESPLDEVAALTSSSNNIRLQVQRQRILDKMLTPIITFLVNFVMYNKLEMIPEEHISCEESSSSHFCQKVKHKIMSGSPLQYELYTFSCVTISRWKSTIGQWVIHKSSFCLRNIKIFIFMPKRHKYVHFDS